MSRSLPLPRPGHLWTASQRGDQRDRRVSSGAGAGEAWAGDRTLLMTPNPVPQGVIQGTVPYLGTFLTDLVMLDTAMKDYLYVSEPGLGEAGAG